MRKSDKRQNEQRRKKLRKRRGKRIAVVVIEVLILCILGVTAFGMFKLGKLNRTSIDEDIANNGVSKKGYTNIALFGTDNRTGETEGVRSDCIIIASINNQSKEVKLLSVYRDTMLQQESGSFDKANSAYATGGPEAAINMLNRNLDLDITDYVSVNFKVLADVVDLLGGIELDMSAEEVVHMNNYCVETSEIAEKEYTRIDPEEAGTYQLNGVQAVSYSRIRYTEGGDFQRTARQRLVIEKIAEKAKSAKLSTINKIVDTVLPEVSTSFSSTEILKMAGDILKYKIGENSGFPFTTAMPESIPGYVGSYVVPIGLVENVKQIHEFLFGEKEYEPTKTVKSLSEELYTITGISVDTPEGQAVVDEEGTGEYTEEDTGDYGEDNTEEGTGEYTEEDAGGYTDEDTGEYVEGNEYE